MFVSDILPDNYRLELTHLHSRNSSRAQRKNSKYRTIAKIVDQNDGSVIAASDARCHKVDDPSRKTGRVVASARAIAKFAYLMGYATDQLTVVGTETGRHPTGVLTPVSQKLPGLERA